MQVLSVTDRNIVCHKIVTQCCDNATQSQRRNNAEAITKSSNGNSGAAQTIALWAASQGTQDGT